jgi:hypothetical protein
MSYTIMGAAVYPMKYAFKDKRPDSSARNSFPSGHTATAFMGAQFLYEEYKDVSPWIGYAGFTIAAATGYLRIYNHCHSRSMRWNSKHQTRILAIPQDFQEIKMQQRCLHYRRPILFKRGDGDKHGCYILRQIG